MAFRPGMVDLPEGHREANVNAITLPEVFHDFDTALPEINDIDIEAQFAINQSRADEITMREDYGSLSLSLHDDGFGDIGFDGDTPDLIRAGLDSTINNQLFEENVIASESKPEFSKLNDAEMSSGHLDGDSFGDEFGQPKLFEDDIFGEPPMDTRVNKEISANDCVNDSDDDDNNHFNSGNNSPMYTSHDSQLQKLIEDSVGNKNVEDDLLKEKENVLEQSTIVQNEDESFALAPIDASAYKGITKTKRKRKLIVDEIKNISGEEMKAQLANTSDIVTTLDLAPPTKRWLMYWKETGGVEKLFSLPSRTIPARFLFVNYQRHLISRFTQLEDFSALGPSDLLAIDQFQHDSDINILNNRKGRKRKVDSFGLNNQINENIGDVNQQSLVQPELMRDAENYSAVGGISINANVNTTDSANGIPLFETVASPEHFFSMNDVHHVTNSDDIPYITRNAENDINDEFNQSDPAPTELHHDHLSPHHSGIENIDSLPNLNVDQVSSILNESKDPDGVTESNADKSYKMMSEWNDYDLPLPIELQNPCDEQLENETNEQFEERVLNKRAAQLFYAVKSRLVKQERLLLSELTTRNSRKQAAQKFYSLLVLKKFRALDISQSIPYSEVVITRGPLFENPKL
ncbi:double-strand-break repair protein rad21 homolog [Teleopsis dalmanni]|nr:double-strand-break repair protein rad21 homolog [Teleopsis dalmanni]